MRQIAMMVIVVLALPMVAHAEDCDSVTISHDPGLMVTEHTVNYVGIRMAIVGSYLWVQFDAADRWKEVETSSVDVSDPRIERVIVCPDRTMTAVLAEPDDPVRVQIAEPVSIEWGWIPSKLPPK